VPQLLQLHAQAVTARHEDVLRVFRVLQAQSVLVLGALSPTSSTAAATPATGAQARSEAEEMLAAPPDAALKTATLLAAASKYADAARACGLSGGHTQLEHAVLACTGSLAAVRREVSNEAVRATAAEDPASGAGPAPAAAAARAGALPPVAGHAQLDAQLARLASAGQ